MASVGEGDCHKDPNFAVICSCLDKYGESLGLPCVSYLDLKTYLEDTSPEGCRVLIDIHVRLLRRIGKSSVTADRFEKSIIKFCHHFSEFDAWEVESYGYRHAQISTKLRILKNLLECQFDFNVKFKEKVNESSAEDMRVLPIGRDKEGQAYWYFVDKDNNLMVYKEEQDDDAADTWQLICSDRQQLADLVESLQKNAKTEVKEEDDKSTSVSRSSKEGSPDKELVQTSTEVLPSTEGLKKEEPGKASESPPNQNTVIKQEVADPEPPQDIKELSSGQVQNAITLSDGREQLDSAQPDSNIQSSTSSNKNTEIKKEENVDLNSTEIGESEVKSVDKENSKPEAAAEVSKPAAENVSSDDKESPTETVVEKTLTDSATKSSETKPSHDTEDKTSAITNEPLKSSGSALPPSVNEQSSEKEVEDGLIAKKSEQNSDNPSLETNTTKEKADINVSNAKPENKECLSEVNESSLEETATKDILVQNAKHTKEDKPSVSSEEPEQCETEDSQKAPASSLEMSKDSVKSNSKAKPSEKDGEALSNCSSESAAHAIKDQSKTGAEDDKQVKPVEDLCESQGETVSHQSSDDVVTDVKHDQAGNASHNGDSNSNSKGAENSGAKVCNEDILKPADSGASDSKDITESNLETKDKPEQGLSVGPEDQPGAVQKTEIASSESHTLSNSSGHSHSEVSEKSTSDTVSAQTVVSNNQENQRLSSMTSDIAETVSMSKDPPDKAMIEKSESNSGPKELETTELSKEPNKLGGLELDSSKKGIQGKDLEGEERSECNKKEKDETIKSSEVIKQLAPESQNITVNNVTADGTNILETNSVGMETKCNGIDKLEDITVAKKVMAPTVNGHVSGDDSSKKMNKTNTKISETAERDTASVSETCTDTNVSELHSARVSKGVNSSGDVKREGEAGPFEASEDVKIDNKKSEEEHCEKGNSNKSEGVDSQEKVTSNKESTVEMRPDLCHSDEPENVAEDLQGPSSSDSEKEKSKTLENKAADDVDEAKSKAIGNKTAESDDCHDTKKDHDKASESEVSSDKNAVYEKVDKEKMETKKEMMSCDNLNAAGEKDIVTKSANLNTVPQSKENITDEKDEQTLTNVTTGDTEEGQRVEDVAPGSKEALKIVESISNDKEEAAGEKSEDKEGENTTETLTSVKDGCEELAKNDKKESNEVNVESQKLKENNHGPKEKENMERGEEGDLGNKVAEEAAEINTASVEQLDGVVEPEVDKITKESEKERAEENKALTKEMSEKPAVIQTNVKESSGKELDKESSVPKLEGMVNDEVQNKETNEKEIELDESENNVADANAKKSKEDKNKKVQEMESKETDGKDKIEKLESEQEKSDMTKSDCSKQEETLKGNKEEQDVATKEGSNGKSADSKQSAEKDVEDKAMNSPATPSSGRKLKRAAPDAGSDDSPGITEQPDGKRARQMARVTRTRGGRNAAARGRAAIQATQVGSESEDSEAAPSSRGRGGKRGRGGRGRGRGRGASKASRANSKTKNEDAADDEAAANEKRAKKKKPDSSTEDLSGEEVTPAKKGRNQAQTPSGGTPVGTPRGGRGGKRGRGRGRGRGSAVSAQAADNSALRRSTRVRQTKARKPPTSPSEESSEDTEEETEEEEHDSRAKDFLDASFTPEEESSDEEFKPKGRNFQRQEARTIKEENSGECVNDDTPCLKCGKYNHPEMILLCDKCDAGYHTACLRPPLMLIPDGDWYCPPCEHSSLVTKLMECLQALDIALKKKDRLKLRQERLAYVGINIGNILQAGERKIKPSDKFDNAEEDEENDDPSTKKRKKIKSGESGEEDGNEDDEVTEDEEVEDEEATEDSGSAYSSEESEPEIQYRSTRLAQRQAQRSSRRKEKQRHKRRKAGGRRSGGATSPEVVYGKRTCRTRSNVSYQFKEFDELISNAIEDDKPVPKERKPGRSTGKDMSNILGVSDDEENEDEDDKPGPVVKRKSKRKLTKLDSDESEQDDESEEFKLSEDDSDATEVEEEEEEEEVNSDESADSGAWKPKKTWYNSKSVRRPKKSRFVVEDDEYDSDENARKRRSTRNSNRGRVSYNDWGSDDETEEEASFTDYSSEDSRTARKAAKKSKPAPAKKKAKKGNSEEGSQSDSSINRKRKILRKLVKKRRKDESDSEEEDSEEEKQPRKSKGGKSDSDFTLEEGHSSSGAEESQRFKKKNVLRSSDEEDGAEDGEAAAKPNEQTNTPSANTEKVEPVAPEVSNTEVPTKGKGQTAGGNKKSAKGKKRVETVQEDGSAVSAVTGVPGKVRRVSGSDKESGAAAVTPAAPPSKRRQPARRQRGKSSEASAGKDKAQLVIPEVGKGKNVPNFLGVPEDGNDDHAKAADAEKQQPVKSEPTSHAPTVPGGAGPQESHPAAMQQQSGIRPPFPGQMGPHQHPGMPPQGPLHPQQQVRQQHPMPQFPQGQRFQDLRMGSPPHYPGAGGVPRPGYYPGLEPGQIPPGQRMGGPANFQHQSQVGGGMTPPQSSSQHPAGPGIPPQPQHSQGYPRGPVHHPQYPMAGHPPPQTSSQAGDHPHNPAVYAQQQQPPVPHQPFPGAPHRMPPPREMAPGQGYYGMRGPYFGQPYGMMPGQMPPGNMNSPLTRMGQMTRNLGPNTMAEPSPPVVAEKRPSLGSPPHSAEGSVKPEVEGAGGRTKQPKLEGDAKGSEKPVTGVTKKQRSKGKKVKQEAASNQSPPQGMPPGVAANQGMPTAPMQRAPAPNSGLPQVPGMMQGHPPHPGMHQANQGPPPNQGLPQGTPQGMPQAPPGQVMAQGQATNQAMPQGPPSNQTMPPGHGMPQGPPGQGLPQGTGPSHGMPLGPPPNQSMHQGPPQGPPTSQGMPQGPPPHGMVPNQGMPQMASQNQGMPQGPMSHGMPQYQGMRPAHGGMYAGHMPPYGMPQYPHHMPYMPHPHYQQQRPYLPPPPHGPPQGPPQGPAPQTSQAPDDSNKTVATSAPTASMSTPVPGQGEEQSGQKGKDSTPPSMAVTSLSTSVGQPALPTRPPGMQATGNLSPDQTSTNPPSGQPDSTNMPPGQPAPANPSLDQQASTNPSGQQAQANVPPGQPLSASMSPSQQTPANMPQGQPTSTNIPHGQQTPANMPPGQPTPTNMPSGQQTPANMPPGQQTPPNMPPGTPTSTNMPPGQQTPTNVPHGQQTPPNMPPGQQTPTNMPHGQQPPTNVPLGQPMPTNMPPGQMMPPYGMGMPGHPGMYYGPGPYGGYPYNQAMPPPHPHGAWGPYGGHPHRFPSGMAPYGQGGPVQQQQQQPPQPPNMPPSSTPPTASPGATPPHVPAAARSSRTPSTESQPGSAAPQPKSTSEPLPRTQTSSSPSSAQNQPPSSSSPASSTPSITPQSQQLQPAVSSSAAPPSTSELQRTTEPTSGGETPMSSSNSAQTLQAPQTSNATSQPPVSTSSSPAAAQHQPVPVSSMPQHQHQQPPLSSLAPPHHQVPPPGFQQWAGPPPGVPPYSQHPQYQQHPWMGMDPYRGPHPGMNPNFQQGYYPGPPQAYGAPYPYPSPMAQQGAPPSMPRPQEMPPVSQPHDGQSSTQQPTGQDSKVEAPKPKRAKTQKKSAVKDEEGGGGVSTPSAGKSKGGSSSRGRGGGRGGFMIDNLLHKSKEGGPEERGADNAADIANDIASYVATDEYFKQKTSS